MSNSDKYFIYFRTGKLSWCSWGHPGGHVIALGWIGTQMMLSHIHTIMELKRNNFIKYQWPVIIQQKIHTLCELAKVVVSVRLTDRPAVSGRRVSGEAGPTELAVIAGCVVAAVQTVACIRVADLRGSAGFGVPVALTWYTDAISIVESVTAVCTVGTFVLRLTLITLGLPFRICTESKTRRFKTPDVFQQTDNAPFNHQMSEFDILWSPVSHRDTEKGAFCLICTCSDIQIVPQM